MQEPTDFTVKYADYFMDTLLDLGYTHCFFLSGGNVMHLIESARSRFTCIPFLHEVSACIAAEYFNEVGVGDEGRAFVVVTAGPGVTNCTTAVAGAWLESRELLVVGGQARTNFLSDGTVRQIGHQEIDGCRLFAGITKASVRLDSPICRHTLGELASLSWTPRKGPVFLEACLDVTAEHIDAAHHCDCAGPYRDEQAFPTKDVDSLLLAEVVAALGSSTRPVLLLGGGMGRIAVSRNRGRLRSLGIPIMTTWNGMDRMGFDEPLFAGRPQAYGMRFSNIAIQQSDLVVAIGTRLGLQQTGFAWDEFVPVGRVAQVDIDEGELRKGHPKVDWAIHADADRFLEAFLDAAENLQSHSDWADWASFVADLAERLPLADPENSAHQNHIEAYQFVSQLADHLSADDVVIPCSSGGAFTTMMQAFRNRTGQLVATNMGHASMGYGLAGAIGAALRYPSKRVILVEGDGGFTQNLQELGTVQAQGLNLKVFILDNDGYASIKTSLKSYFDGHYIGCDAASGLGLPNWGTVFDAFRIPWTTLGPEGFASEVTALLEAPGPAGIVVSIDPEQQFWPKILSRVDSDGSMRSNPLHLMTPPLPTELHEYCLQYLPTT